MVLLCEKEFTSPTFDRTAGSVLMNCFASARYSSGPGISREAIKIVITTQKMDMKLFFNLVNRRLALPTITICSPAFVQPFVHEIGADPA